MLQSSDRSNRMNGRRAQAMDAIASSLPITADATRGGSNASTVPRSGNMSTDTRAGRPG